MDIRPGDRRDNKPTKLKHLAGWMPRCSLDQRIYHSWAYPVSSRYAVQLYGTCPVAGRSHFDDDEVVRDEYGAPRPLRQRDIARILNEWELHRPLFLIHYDSCLLVVYQRTGIRENPQKRSESELTGTRSLTCCCRNSPSYPVRLIERVFCGSAGSF
jgi:hypothetical protein